MSKSDQRVSQAKELMEQRGLEVLVGFSNGICSFTDSDPIWSMTRYRPIDETIAVIPRIDNPALIVKTPWEANTASKYMSKELILTASDPVDGLRQTLARSKNSVVPAKVGVAGLNSMNKIASDRVSSLLGKNKVEADEIVPQLGKARYQDEIELAKKASSIADRGYARLLETVHVGMREFELAGQLSCYMKSLGADDNFQLIATSQHNTAVRQPTDRLLEKNDIILAEISPGVDGVFVQICRSAIIGEVPEIVEKKYALLSQSFDSGLDMVRPGVKVSEVVAAMNEVLARAGYEKYCHPPYMRARGHGMGLGSIMPGDLTHDNETRLEEGEMFVLHPNQYIPETGYFLCGDSIIVSGNSPTRLTGKTLSVSSINPRR